MAATIEKYAAEIRKHELLAKQADKILALARPHIRLVPRKAKAADNKPGASRFGGEPDLPEGTEWPIGPGFDDDEVPMDFLAQIDLDSVALRDVDGLLPRTGVLAFFGAQNYEGCAVIHGEHDTLVRVSDPRLSKKKKKAAKPPKWGGFDIIADTVLPPPWSHFVSSKKRSASAWNPRTNKTGKGKTLVELPDDAHAAYVDIFDRWNSEADWPHHGMFGYERQMECVQEPDELALLRLDYDERIPYDFVEVVSIYFFITEDALVARKFDAVEAYFGSTI